MDGLLVKPISHENWSERMSKDSGCHGWVPVNDRSQVSLITLYVTAPLRSKLVDWKFCYNFWPVGKWIFVSTWISEDGGGGEGGLVYIRINVEEAIFTKEFMLSVSTGTCRGIMPARQCRCLAITDSCLWGIWLEWGITWMQLSINHSKTLQEGKHNIRGRTEGETYNNIQHLTSDYLGVKHWFNPSFLLDAQFRG